jgi:hypothetical protein
MYLSGTYLVMYSVLLCVPICVGKACAPVCTQAHRAKRWIVIAFVFICDVLFLSLSGKSATVFPICGDKWVRPAKWDPYLTWVFLHLGVNIYASWIRLYWKLGKLEELEVVGVSVSSTLRPINFRGWSCFSSSFLKILFQLLP